METAQLCLLADALVSWQTPYGRPDPKKCPYVETEFLVNSMNFHSPTFMAIGLYKAFSATGEIRYKEAADRYVAGYFSCLRNPPDKADFYTETWLEYVVEKTGGADDHLREWAKNILTWPFIYGMALAGYRYFRQYNPDELALESAAAAVYEWLLYWRWDEGSYFRNGYGSPKHGIIDCGNSDDLCHMGRGLTGYHKLTGRDDVLAAAEGLAKYYITECEPGTYKGCWSSELGSWVIAPTIADGIEHFTGQRSCDISWGFSVIGTIEYLTELAAVTSNRVLRDEIAAKCACAMQWQFDKCQFDDGAIGMSGQDDKWLGMTAGAIQCFVRTRDAGFLNGEEIAEYRPKALAARHWLLENVTRKGIEAGGYFPISGTSEPRPPDNLAWMFALTLQTLAQLDRL